jgi:hypothetical protein
MKKKNEARRTAQPRKRHDTTDYGTEKREKGFF